MRSGLLVALGSLVALVGPRSRTQGPASSWARSRTTCALDPRRGERADGRRFASPGSARCGSRATGRPGQTLRRARASSCSPERRGCRRTERRAGLRDRDEPGLGDDTAHRRGAAEFASYAAAIVRGSPWLRHVIVGNEPNLNRFWLPQFGLDGSSAAPAAYLALLAETYDAIKAASPEVRVYGGAVSPRGTDRPNGIGPTHSPTTFIQGLGAAYRASGRTRPVMDALAIHPYMDNSSQPPTTAHPLGTNIDDRRLRQARRAARRGVRRNRPARIQAADLLRRVRRRVGDPCGEGVPVHGQRADDDEARQRGDAGRLLPAGARARVLPADRRGRCCSSSRATNATAALAVRDQLRRRDPEDEPANGHEVARPDRRRLDHAVSRPRAPGATTYLRFGPAPRRSAASSGRASGATSTAATGAARERGDAFDEARDERLSRGRRARAGRSRDETPQGPGRTATRSASSTR